MSGQNAAPSGGAPARHGKLLPPLMLLAIMLTVVAGMGEWKVVNMALGGLPKIVTLGVPGIALLCFLIRADFEHAGRCLKYLPMFMVYILALLLWTLAIWMLDLTEPSSIARGMSKLLYQCFTILYTVGFVYLCRERSVDCFFYSMLATNGLIALLEIPGYGLMPSIQSVITCILTFGNAEGYVRALEIHDVTFLFGQFFVYYAGVAPRRSRRETAVNAVKAALAMFFMLLGLKRSAIPAAILLAVYAAFLLRRKHPFRWVMVTGAGIIVLFWAYLYAINSGLFTRLMALLGVDTMGRDYIWGLAKPYYSFSPAFTGLGFEAVDAIVSQWYQQGLINHPYPFHNDVLKAFVELGFGGFCLWTGVQYLYYPRYWARRHSERTAVLYICLLGYMSVTYLTDNTAFYYWSCIGLRLIPMGYSFTLEQREIKDTWRPPTAGELSMSVWRKEMERHDHEKNQAHA